LTNSRKNTPEVDFDPLVAIVRKRISLSRNKRLRDALAERGEPKARLDKELPGAVAVEWNGTPPATDADAEQIPEEEIAGLVRRVARRLEKQGDEGESKVLRAARREPAYADEDAEERAAQTLEDIAKNAGLSRRELEVYNLTTEGVEDDEIAEILGVERDSVTKTRYRMMKKLREGAAKGGFSEKVRKFS
jgi:DNA-binding CsgD family transcriptional regulator